MERPTENALELVRHFEGFEPKAKPCIAGKMTIGYGHTREAGGFKFNASTVVTREQAEEILVDDLMRVAENIGRFVPWSISGGEFWALVSFAFNVGEGALESSTLLKTIRAHGDAEAVRAQFLRWCKYTDPKTGGRKVAAGLLRRRKAEAALYLGEDFRAHFV